MMAMPGPHKIQKDEVQVNWIIDGKLGQSIYPKAIDFDYLYKEGIRAIVSLEDRPDARIIHDKGFEYLEVYVKDYTAPTIRQLDEIVRV
jgi:hypothetical protein